MKRIEKVLSKAGDVTEELDALLVEIKEKNKARCRETDEVSKKYLDDVAIREKKIREQIKSFENQKQEISATIESMRPQLVEATMAGNAADIKELQERMAELKAREAAIDTQIEILYSTPVNGNADLFEAANVLNEKLIEDNQNYRGVFSALAVAAKEQKDYWERIYQKTTSMYYVPGKYSNEFEKAEKYHTGQGRCVERPQTQEPAPTVKSKNLETAVHRFGAY